MTDRLGEDLAGQPPRPTTQPRIARWLDESLTWLGVTGRFGRDCVLAVAATVVTLTLFALLVRYVPQEADESLTGTRAGLMLVAAGVGALALCLRRVRPYLCLAVTVACQAVIIGAAPEISLRSPAPIVAAYTVGSLATVRAALAAILTSAIVEGAAAALGALVARQPEDLPTVTVDHLAAVTANHLIAGAIVYLGAAFVGSYVATRRQNLRMVQAQAAEAIRTQQARLRAAILAERSQLARELHDVAAHHLSGMVVQAAAVERLIDRDPQAARAGAAWIRRQGRQTLDNLRQVVGLLRGTADADEDGNAPVPGLDALDDLVRTARDLGTEVELVRRGEAVPLPPIADISLFRVAQQALTNARQHAPGAPVRIRLEYSGRDVVLDIVNGPPAAVAESRGVDPEVGSRDGRGSYGGTGLVGMRERADLVGAELVVGPTDDAGWRVHLRLPVTDADGPPEEVQPA